MAAPSNIWACAPVSSVLFSAIPGPTPGTYVAVGEYNLPTRQFIIQNYTNAPVMFSFNGQDDNLPMLPNGYFTNDIGANQINSEGFSWPGGRTLYVRYLTGAPTSGSVWFTQFYAATPNF
jgi:hypothetical protein